MGIFGELWQKISGSDEGGMPEGGGQPMQPSQPAEPMPMGEEEKEAPVISPQPGVEPMEEGGTAPAEEQEKVGGGGMEM